MDITRLEALIKEYQSRIQEAVTLFNIHKNSNPMQWRREGLSQIGFIDPAQTIRYAFHGIGCEVDLPSGPVDWDWGNGGRIDGFDVWRLWQFAQYGSDRFPEFAEKQNLEAVFAEAVAKGVVKKLYPEHHDSLYYFVSP